MTLTDAEIIELVRQAMQRAVAGALAELRNQS